MRVEKVLSMGRSSDASLRTMGNLVDEGILRKEYVPNRSQRTTDIVWTNISTDVIVENSFETIKPGESVTWEK
jgi:hypothetical protein